MPLTWKAGLGGVPSDFHVVGLRCKQMVMGVSSYRLIQLELIENGFF